MTGNPRGKLVVVSGPSGVGKSTLLARVLQQAVVPLVMSVSATTRSPRPGEKDGVDYHFLSEEEFAARRRRGEFLECVEVFGEGHWYGTLDSEVAPRLEQGKWVVLEIDVQGAEAVREKYPQAIAIFIAPPSTAELEERLRGRGTEDQAAVERRLARARQELRWADRYDYQVVNGKLDGAVGRVCEILKKRAGEVCED